LDDWVFKVSIETEEVGTKSDLLVFIVGRSGSGKDTIMRNVASTLLLDDIPVYILQRHITRPPDKTENSLYVSEEEFLQKKSQKDYVLSWFVYDNSYGCPRIPLEESLRKGEIVLVNVSRSILYEAKKKYPKSKIVQIIVPDKVAETRIKNRGREDSKHLTDRLTRMQKKIDMPFPDKIIENEGDLDIAVQEFRDYLRKIYQDSKIQ
jgi:phosphonate metabolism protein PhnN/1,5-bisphosphokinase (PRPP-forming)